jgi:molecular chaperone GrpE
MFNKKKQVNNEEEELLEQTCQTELAQLQTDFAQAQQEKMDNLIGWQRALADYQNLQKEMALQKSQSMAWGEEKVIQEFLPVWENFHKALYSQKQIMEDLQGNISDDGTLKKLKNWQLGMDYVQKQIADLLNEWGARRVPTVGEPFDPACHEAVQTDSDETKADHEILKELSAGYYLKDKLLFPAKVVVNNLGDDDIAEANS